VICDPCRGYGSRVADSELRRSLGPASITLYGLGTILGAGIYVVTGEVAAQAGAAAPLSFLAAGGIALLCGLTFGDLCARLPESAGEAAYVQSAFGIPALSTAVGLAVAVTGVVSAAAIANGVTGYLALFVDLPDAAAVAGLIVVLGVVAAVGVEVSAAVAGLLTLIEVGGLLLVIGAAGGAWADLPERLPELVPGGSELPGVALGAFVAFYAFVGFEDMVNQAEEVRRPERTLPWALLGALLVSTALYLAVSLTCVLTLDPAELAGSDRPLALVFERATGRSPTVISAISLVAVSNGALVQIVMGSRVLYGLARKGWLPAALGRVHPRTRTPLAATAVIVGVVLALALTLDLSTLAQITSAVILAVFAAVNLALFRIARRDGPSPGPWTSPPWLPLLTAALILVFLGLRLAGR
jgi:basic amino acid/polyamine antiporter, APA family